MSQNSDKIKDQIKDSKQLKEIQDLSEIIDFSEEQIKTAQRKLYTVFNGKFEKALGKQRFQELTATLSSKEGLTELIAKLSSEEKKENDFLIKQFIDLDNKLSEAIKYIETSAIPNQKKTLTLQMIIDDLTVKVADIKREVAPGLKSVNKILVELLKNEGVSEKRSSSAKGHNSKTKKKNSKANSTKSSSTRVERARYLGTTFKMHFGKKNQSQEFTTLYSTKRFVAVQTSQQPANARSATATATATAVKAEHKKPAKQS